jgi:hypothetical protein
MEPLLRTYLTLISLLCKAEIGFINGISHFLLQIKIDDERSILLDKCDECSALVFPSEMRRPKTKNNTVAEKRILPDSQRKLLHEIVGRIIKKGNVSVQN